MGEVVKDIFKGALLKAIKKIFAIVKSDNQDFGVRIMCSMITILIFGTLASCFIGCLFFIATSFDYGFIQIAFTVIALIVLAVAIRLLRLYVKIDKEGLKWKI